jgi:hypothetical protein
MYKHLFALTVFSSITGVALAGPHNGDQSIIERGLISSLDRLTIMVPDKKSGSDPDLDLRNSCIRDSMSWAEEELAKGRFETVATSLDQISGYKGFLEPKKDTCPSSKTSWTDMKFDTVVAHALQTVTTFIKTTFQALKSFFVK